jgi:putative ABC transport system permease protein
MTLWTLIAKELLRRKGRFGLGVLSVAVATGTLAGALSLMESHKVRTKELLDSKDKALRERMAALGDGMRKAMLGLGFNVVVLPADQNLADFHAQDYAVRDMPEAYVTRLAASGLITVRHLLPSLQQKVEWPEIRRTVILFGTRGETAVDAKDPEKPMAQPVPAGTVVLGHELARSLGLNAGDATRIFGRDRRVHQVQPARGNKDDITVWMELQDVQEILDKKGRINAILAVECKCAWADLGKVRAEITRILPDTQVIERSSEALARAEARNRAEEEGLAAIEAERLHRAALGLERERLAGVLVPVIVLACSLWIGLLAYGDVRARRVEIGVLRALGFGAGRIRFVFLAKAAVLGLAGGLAGVAAGLLGGPWLESVLNGSGPAVWPPALPPPAAWLPILPAAPLLAMLCSWAPALLAGRQDPAVILRET